MNAKPTRLLKADIATAAAPTTEDDEMEPLPSQPNGARIIAEQSYVQTSM
ncbi:unnamed protein product, partial [Rotaria socialis]